jgi:hypothetical protein
VTGLQKFIGNPGSNFQGRFMGRPFLQLPIICFCEASETHQDEKGERQDRAQRKGTKRKSFGIHGLYLIKRGETKIVQYQKTSLIWKLIKEPGY